MSLCRSPLSFARAAASAGALLAAAGAVSATPPLQPRMGQPLPGLSALELQRFTIGRQLFSRPLSMQDGLGPIMNKSNCGSCHANPTGGWGSIAVTHFGIDNKGEFEPYPGESQSLFQLLAVSQGCAETIPADATIVRSRVTNSSMAFGLIEAIPDAAIAANADPNDANGDGISGRVHWVVPLETPGGAPRAGRFGWKAQIATVLSFSGDAARNEMGFTNRLEPVENAPNNDTARLLQCDPVEDVEDVEDAEGFAFIDRVTHFQRYLAPPPQTPRSGMSGESVFTSIGCAKCHVPQWSSAQDPALEDAIRGRTFRPYSDFLIHDMGLLGDGIQQDDASETEMRTPVLWGLRRRDPMLHDGRAAGGTFESRVTQAIAAHGPLGEGAASAAAFAALGPTERQQLIAFLGSLGRIEFDLDGDNSVGLGDFALMRQCITMGTTNPDHPCAVADIDQSGTVNALDMAAFVLAFEGDATDCNGNGTSDLVDIAIGGMPDNDGDGLPDTCAGCTADLNGDGTVNGFDLSPVLAGWGTAGASDLNHDGVTNGLDLTAVLAAWGPCR
ncbi:MAG: hypothetical protein FGM37_07700 [Phycisphaerales bacterium]|nr:hypothetical protein [Phycisphaerales bacterium]